MYFIDYFYVIDRPIINQLFLLFSNFSRRDQRWLATHRGGTRTRVRRQSPRPLPPHQHPPRQAAEMCSVQGHQRLLRRLHVWQARSGASGGQRWSGEVVREEQAGKRALYQAASRQDGRDGGRQLQSPSR